MDFEGKVLTVLPVVKGTNARGEWVKQEVIFEQPGEFNRKICVGFGVTRPLKPEHCSRVSWSISPPMWSRVSLTDAGTPTFGHGA